MATNVNVGTAFLTIVPSTRGFVKALKRELNKAGWHKIGKSIGKSVEDGFKRSGVMKRIRRSFTDMFLGIRDLGRYGLFDTLIASALAVVSALAPLAGLVLGIPAAAVAAGLAIGALALAVDGLGTSLGAALSGDAEEFEEALKGMTTSARSVTKEIGTALFGLKDIAQEAFFAPMVGAAKGLGEALQGPVRNAISSVATALGEAGAVVFEWLASANGASALEKAAKAASTTIREMSAGIVPLLRGVFDLAEALDAHVGQAIGNVATRFGEWMSEIAANGSAEKWFKAAMDAASQLWDVLVNVGRTVAAIFGAASADGGSLRVLVSATAAMAEWAESAKGQETLNHIFQFFGTILREVVTAIGTLVAAFAVVAEWFNSLSPQTQSTIAQFLAWSIVLAPLTGRMVAVVSVLKGLFGAVSLVATGLKVATLGTARFFAGMVKGAGQGASAATKIGAAFTRIAAAIGRAIARGAVWIAQMAVIAAKAVASAAKTAAAWTVNAARGIATFVAQAAVAFATTIAGFVRMAAQAAITAGRVVAGWVLMGVQSLIQAARMAAAWVIAMGPIGWVIAAIIALVALIIVYWDEIKAALQAAWQWITDLASTVWNGIVEFFTGIWESIKGVFSGAWDWLLQKHIEFAIWIKEQWDALWQGVKDFFSGIWDAIVSFIEDKVSEFRAIVSWFSTLGAKFREWVGNAKDAAIDKFQELLTWAGGLPGRILDAIGDLGSTLFQAGKDLLNGLKEGIMSAWDSIQDTLSGLTDKLPDWKGPESVDRKILYKPGQVVMGGLEDSFRDSFPAIRSTLQDLTTDIQLVTSRNLGAVGPADPRANGVTIESLTFQPQTADNRFSYDEFQNQVKMRVG